MMYARIQKAFNASNEYGACLMDEWVDGRNNNGWVEEEYED